MRLHRWCALSDLLTQLHQVPMPPRRDEHATVHRFPFQGDDVRLVESLRQGHPAAIAHFYALFAGRVQRMDLFPDISIGDAPVLN